MRTRDIFYQLDKKRKSRDSEVVVPLVEIASKNNVSRTFLDT